jgi:hypothetical protein
MAILVRNKGNNNLYYLIGTGYSYYKDSRPSYIGGNLLPYTEEGESSLAAVCNMQGDIEWFPTDELRVIEIDGVKVGELHSSADLERMKEETMSSCPACNAIVSVDAKVCKSCGLTLIVEEEDMEDYTKNHRKDDDFRDTFSPF